VVDVDVDAMRRWTDGNAVPRMQVAKPGLLAIVVAETSDYPFGQSIHGKEATA
jgi:hypothetical protein